MKTTLKDDDEMNDKHTYHFFKKMEAYFFDLDGCVYHGEKLDYGAKRLIERLRVKRKKIYFITNNSRQSGREVSKKLTQMGLPIDAENIITATDYVYQYVQEKYGIVPVKIVGSDSLQNSFIQAGFRILPLSSEQKTAIIVIGRDTEFTYGTLQQIVETERQGARIVSVNPDTYHPGIGGVRVPETGAIIAAVQSMIGKKVEYFGKPAPYLFRYGMKLCGEEAKNCVMVGDNPHTDILGGSNAGMKTVWIRLEQALEVLEEDVFADHKPDCIVKNMDELVRLYEY